MQNLFISTSIWINIICFLIIINYTIKTLERKHIKTKISYITIRYLFVIIISSIIILMFNYINVIYKINGYIYLVNAISSTVLLIIYYTIHVIFYEKDEQKYENKSKILLSGLLLTFIVMLSLLITNLWYLNIMNLSNIFPFLGGIFFLIFHILLKFLLGFLPEKLWPNNFQIFLKEKFKFYPFAENLFSLNWFKSRFIMYFIIYTFTFIYLHQIEKHFILNSLTKYLGLLLIISTIFTIIMYNNYGSNSCTKSFICFFIFNLFCLGGSRFLFLSIIENNIFILKQNKFNLFCLHKELYKTFINNKLNIWFMSNIKLETIMSNYSHLLINNYKLFKNIFLNNNYNIKDNGFISKLLNWLYKEGSLYDNSKTKYIKHSKNIKICIFPEKYINHISLPYWAYANSTLIPLDIFDVNYKVKTNLIFFINNFTFNEFIFNYSINGLDFVEINVIKSEILPRIAKYLPETMYLSKQTILNFNSNIYATLCKIKNIESFALDKFINSSNSMFSIFEKINCKTYNKFSSIRDCTTSVIRFAPKGWVSEEIWRFGSTRNLDFIVDQIFHWIRFLTLEIYPRLAHSLVAYPLHYGYLEDINYTNFTDLNLSHWRMFNNFFRCESYHAEFEDILSNLYHHHNDVFMKVHNLHKPYFFLEEIDISFYRQLAEDYWKSKGDTIPFPLYDYLINSNYIQSTSNDEIAELYLHSFGDYNENLDKYSYLSQQIECKDMNWSSLDWRIYSNIFPGNQGFPDLTTENLHVYLAEQLGFYYAEYQESEYKMVIKDPVNYIGITMEQLEYLLKVGSDSNTNKVRNLCHFNYHKTEYRGFIDVSCKIK